MEVARLGYMQLAEADEISSEVCSGEVSAEVDPEEEV